MYAPPLASWREIVISSRRESLIIVIPSRAPRSPVAWRRGSGSVVLFGPHERSLLVRLQHIPRRRTLQVLEAAQALVDGRLGVLNTAARVNRQSSDRVFEQIEIAVRIHRRDADADERAALRRYERAF